jgi:regulator of protease activity HflC (stomatin/prohibitin superfamily)
VIFVQAIIFLAALALATFAAKNAVRKDGTVAYGRIVEAVAVLAVAIGLDSSFGEIPAGFRGVVLRFGATTGEVKQPGFYVVTPFVTTVAAMNLQVQAYSTEAAAASHDLQNVETTVTLNYTVDPDKVVDIYNRLNQDYQDRIITPAIQEATKAATAQFTAEELITRRPEARNLLEKDLSQRLNEFDIHIAAMSITNFQFSADFTSAIEAKVVAFQNYLKSQNTLKQVQVEAQQAIAQAQGEATANRLRRQQISVLTVQYDAVQKWDGKLPSVTGSAIPFFNLGNLDSVAK